MPHNHPAAATDDPQMRADLAEIHGDGLLFLTGLDDCVLGVIEEPGQLPRVAYGVEKILRALERGGASEEEALEHFDANIAGLRLGPRTPALILERPSPDA